MLLAISNWRLKINLWFYYRPSHAGAHGAREEKNMPPLHCLFPSFLSGPSIHLSPPIALSRNDIWAAFEERALNAIGSFYLSLDVKQG